MSRRHWEFWIDRGGSFTDCIGIDPQGTVHQAKILSSDMAPVDGVRRILAAAGEPDAGAATRDCSIKLGSTVATNALLERRGVPTALVANRGLGDVFEIGTQQRPELFELAIERAAPLHAPTVEIPGRIGADGASVEPFDADSVRAALARARESGARSLAVALIHATLDPELEQRCATLAREAGFEFVVASHEIANEQGLLARGETATADAYLTPLLRRHVDELATHLPGARLRFMQSSGGLTTVNRFRGPNALLSGPAGGVAAAARIAHEAGFERAISFDMGGTSTDVSLIVDGEVERAFETVIGGVRVKAPMLRIHTVAAGGGSLCGFDGFSLTVGPESAGAWPGPLCYGRCDEAGRRVAERVALTDANAALGRVQPDRFAFSLDRAVVDRALAHECVALARAGFSRTPEELAAGFVEVANAHMAQAIAEVSVARGVDPRDCALVAFGGAAGQHACAIATLLGIREVLLHPFAGLLSAYGIGSAPATWDGQRDAGRVELAGLELPGEVARARAALEREGRASLAGEGVAPASVVCEWRLDLRYRGTDAALAIVEPAAVAAPSAWRMAFEAEHRRRFGYARPQHAIEIATARVRAVASAPEWNATATPVESGAAGEPLRAERVWFNGRGWCETPVYDRGLLAAGQQLEGPALVLEDTGTLVLDPGFLACVEASGLLRLTRQPERGSNVAARPAIAADDPVRLEVFGSRFMSIAEQMGAVLRKTAISTNIKERLDYSCAVFDAAGGLVANAPHIPVHLGAMGETVRCTLERFGDELEPGDAVATNDPFEGGSHLPDVTVTTPVFLSGTDERRPAFFVASRGHHADIGGRTPGSMPPDSVALEEEGVVLEPFRVVRAGRFDEAGLRERLAHGRYPARRPDDNVADLEAMLAANEAGVAQLVAFVREQSVASVTATMAALQRTAAAKVAREIGRLADGMHRFEDQLDDGTPVCVALEVDGERMRIDFAGTGAAVAGNLNAPRAVVQAAVLYVLRTLVAERIPLNGGCLEPVEIEIPPGSLLDPPRGAAVAGGNVETSQRVVDVLLGALGRAAASQGTMNNVTFGDESFGYYETIGGGAGAGPSWDGASGVHTHMTNTRITDPEVLESRYPVRLECFALREGSGGQGAHRGGDGLVRRYRFAAPITASWLTERRAVAPWGLAGGDAGLPGLNRVIRGGGEPEQLGSSGSIELAAGDELVIETPGGGGYGRPAR
ncbi:MAG: hydantoinase B/oxoprolinase family protein [Myxococcota bacterium]|nr:hydantoinase B/oxoprolinase family protein [Myxococcota bacterium]